MIINDRFEIVHRREVSLPVEQWGRIDAAGKRSGVSIAQLLRSLSNCPALLQQLERHIKAVVDNEDLPDIEQPIVRPKNPVSETVARIQATNDAISIRYPIKNERFREVVKNQGFSWDRDDSCWRRVISAENGLIIDRAAETGATLLKNGYCVTFPGQPIRDLAITQEYEPEHRRLIKAITSQQSQYKNWFFIWWARSEDLYDEVKKLPGARYVKPGIAVPPEHLDDVLDFAEIHGFHFTDKARELVERVKIWKSQAITVSLDEIDEADILPVDDFDGEFEIKEYQVADEFLDAD